MLSTNEQYATSVQDVNYEAICGSLLAYTRYLADSQGCAHTDSVLSMPTSGLRLPSVSPYLASCFTAG